MTASSYRVLGRGAGAGSGAQSQVLKAGKLFNGGIRLGNITGSIFESRKLYFKFWSILLITDLVSERLDHGEVRDNLERVDILDKDVTGDVFELDVVQEDGHFLAKLCGISITVVLTPH